MWAKKEVRYMQFNDLRINNRIETILDDMTEQPDSSIPKTCKTLAATKAIYRMLSNEKVEAQEIRNGYRLATIDRMKECPKGSIFLFPSDATNLVFTGRKMNGIGVLRNQKARGLNLHTTLALTTNGLVLGSIDQTCWGRKSEDYGKRAERFKKPIQEKESYRWIEHLERVQEALPDDAIGIFIADRGGDIYDIFLYPCKPNVHLLIRSSVNRRLANDSGKMFDVLESSLSMGTMEVEIPRSGARKSRTTKLEIRFEKVKINPPMHRKNLPFIDINIISAREVCDELNTLNPINWRLLTTLPVSSLDDAINAVSTYAKRWIIERYHYTLKEGCKVEELQLEEAIRVDKAVALYSIVACRLMYMMHLARIAPDEPCISILEKDEWQALYCYSKKTTQAPKAIPTNREAVRMIAKMGGFLGRKSDGDPGVKTIWQGMQVLEGAVEMYRIFKGKDVGNG